jgi:small-conductance mechanosensitive channel
VDFSSFAIIAGALSVGIGFGLQNVVNNFVSGLILLFERPIRTGDWIVVGPYEGIVRRISVRSTVVQTFDRGDVILPNGDLISSPVKNFTLGDRVGRVQINLGVEYGTDTEAVRRLLLDAALSHPKVIRGGMAPAPWVWFIGFGESSLDFQLTAFVSEVSERMTIASDLNFAVERRLREAGIEVPYPQRDVTVRFAQPVPRGVVAPEPDEGDADHEDSRPGRDACESG